MQEMNPLGNATNCYRNKLIGSVGSNIYTIYFNTQLSNREGNIRGIDTICTGIKNYYLANKSFKHSHCLVKEMLTLF